MSSHQRRPLGESSASIGPGGASDIRHVCAVVTAANEYGEFNSLENGERYRLCNRDNALRAMVRSAAWVLDAAITDDQAASWSWLPTGQRDQNTSFIVATHIVKRVRATLDVPCMWEVPHLVGLMFNTPGIPRAPVLLALGCVLVPNLDRLSGLFGLPPPAAATQAAPWADTVEGWTLQYQDVVHALPALTRVPIPPPPAAGPIFWGTNSKQQSANILASWARFSEAIPAFIASLSTAINASTVGSPSHISRLSTIEEVSRLAYHVNMPAPQLSAAVLAWPQGGTRMSIALPPRQSFLVNFLIGSGQPHDMHEHPGQDPFGDEESLGVSQDPASITILLQKKRGRPLLLDADVAACETIAECFE